MDKLERMDQICGLIKEVKGTKEAPQSLRLISISSLGCIRELTQRGVWIAKIADYCKGNATEITTTVATKVPKF